ncbi:hypothetical protein LCGC14_2846760, partial [marine sediment metagenome]
MNAFDAPVRCPTDPPRELLPAWLVKVRAWTKTT